MVDQYDVVLLVELCNVEITGVFVPSEIAVLHRLQLTLVIHKSQ